MDRKKHVHGRLRPWATLLTMGALLGAVMLTPVAAHHAPNHTRKQIKKVRQLAKKANKTAKTAQTAADAAQEACQPGAVLASALVKGSSTFPSTFTSSATNAALFGPRFNCASPTNEIKALRVQEGHYEVSFPGISNAANNQGEYVAHVTIISDEAGFPDAHATAYLTRNDPAEGDVLRIRLQDVTPADAGTTDELFAVTVYDYTK
jgi:hypothetical protein